ncbi:MAG: hypothetical protein QOD50_386, partial [Actinomycetota bacterium]|nr:hypothetical protein [Actinomycetota bacterium]
MKKTDLTVADGPVQPVRKLSVARLFIAIVVTAG